MAEVTEDERPGFAKKHLNSPIDEKVLSSLCYYHYKYGNKAIKCKKRNAEGISCPMHEKLLARMANRSWPFLDNIDQSEFLGDHVASTLNVSMRYCYEFLRVHLLLYIQRPTKPRGLVGVRTSKDQHQLRNWA